MPPNRIQILKNLNFEEYLDNPITELRTAALVIRLNMWIHFGMRSIDTDPTVKLSNFMCAVPKICRLLI